MKCKKTVYVTIALGIGILLAGCLPLPVAPPKLKVVSTLKISGRANALSLKGNYLFVAAHRGGIKVIDISDISNPKVVASTGREDFGSLLVYGDVLYAGTFSPPYKFVAYDIRDPRNPIRIADVHMLGPIFGITAWGHYCYLSEGGLFLLDVVDISNPANPQVVSQVEGSSNGLIAYGNYVFVAEDTSFRIYDVSNPNLQTLIGSCRIPGGPQDVELAYNYAYVAALDGLHVIDLSDLTRPREVSFQKTEKPAYGIAVTTTNVYLANYESGLAVFDISADKKKPKFAGNITLPGLTFDVIVKDGTVITANDTEGITILR